jgi:hypothetical protein
VPPLVLSRRQNDPADSVSAGDDPVRCPDPTHPGQPALESEGGL